MNVAQCLSKFRLDSNLNDLKRTNAFSTHLPVDCTYKVCKYTRSRVALCAFTTVAVRSFIEVLRLRGGISKGEIKSLPSETLKFHRPG